jgi:hypothetical protein
VDADLDQLGSRKLELLGDVHGGRRVSDTQPERREDDIAVGIDSEQLETLEVVETIYLRIKALFAKWAGSPIEGTLLERDDSMSTSNCNHVTRMA